MSDTPQPHFSTAFAEHLQQPPPDFLYHYTTQQGLLGIVDSGTLWATNIGYLNDATEFSLSLELIRDRLLNELRETEREASHFASADPHAHVVLTKERIERRHYRPIRIQRTLRSV